MLYDPTIQSFYGIQSISEIDGPVKDGRWIPIGVAIVDPRPLGLPDMLTPAHIGYPLPHSFPRQAPDPTEEVPGPSGYLLYKKVLTYPTPIPH